MGCRRVISTRLTSCELTNWCFGPTTTPAVDFRIICAAQIRTHERLKRLVSIWLSLKLQWIQLQPQKKRKKKTRRGGKRSNGGSIGQNKHRRHTESEAQSEFTRWEKWVHKRGQEVGDGGKIDSCVQRKSSAQRSLWPERHSPVWFSANQSF